MHQRVAASHSFLACHWLSLTVAASHSFWACCLLSLIVAHLQKQQQSTKASLSIGGVGGSNLCHGALEMSQDGLHSTFFFNFLALLFPFCLQFATRYPNKMGGGL
jgi:RsiW-degrading membrane proteinase PrsW (M82 family)